MTELLSVDEGRSRYVVEVRAGATAPAEIAPELDALVRACGAPVTASSAWTASRLAHAPGLPWLVAVRDPNGRLDACAVLLDSPAPDGSGCGGTTALAFGGDGHWVQLPARDASAGAALATALAGQLRRRGLDVMLGPLLPDVTVHALADALHPDLTLHLCDPVPAIRVTPGGRAEEYLPSGVRRTLRKSRNRLTADGVTSRITVTADPGRIARRLPELAAAYRERDEQHGITSQLLDPVGYGCWSGRLLALAAAGTLELATLDVGEALVAYLVGLPDRDAYRILEGRFVSAWARYAPGRLLEEAVLQRVLDDGRLTCLDWMTAVAPEALPAMNDATPVVVATMPGSRPGPGSIAGAGPGRAAVPRQLGRGEAPSPLP